VGGGNHKHSACALDRLDNLLLAELGTMRPPDGGV
jgi:hypothetical protein